MKRTFLIYFVLVILLSSFALAQLEGVEDRLEGTVENIEGNVTKAREFTEREKWDFLSEQWKQIFLKNKIVSGTNDFFTKINDVFIFLFSRDWSLSIEMFFVFLLWLFFLLSAYSYSSLWFEKQGYKLLVSFVVVIILAWMQIFNILSKAIFNVFLYKSQLLWRFFSFAMFIAIIVLFYVINRKIKESMAKSKEGKENKELEHRVEKEEAFIKGVKKGL